MIKSGKQKRIEIKQKRRQKAAQLSIDTAIETRPLPTGAVAADHSELIHNNTYAPLPLFYIDKAFTCRDCGSNELWTGKQQKWWYEIAKGHIDSTAVLCRTCRDRIKAHKDQQRQHMHNMTKKPPHPHDTFFKH